MNRKFTLRETIMILILALLLAGCGYYFLVLEPTTQAITEASLRREDADALIVVEEARAAKLDQMKQELEKLSNGSVSHVSEIASYDNVQNVVQMLHGALSQADHYNLVFSPVTFDGHIVSRPIDMTFNCAQYDTAKSIISSLYASPYRCEISSLTLLSQSKEAGADISKDAVSVKLTITFYEYSEKVVEEDPENPDASSGSSAK